MRSSIIAVFAFAIGSAQQSAPSLPASGNVSLPLDEYNKLVELANHPAKPPGVPPVAYVLKSAQVSLTVKGESVTGTIVIEGEVLAKGVQKVPLATGVFVLDAQQKGGELTAVRENGILTGLFDGPREFAVTLTVALPLVIETGRASFALPVPAAGSAMLTLSVPGDQTAINLTRGIVTSRASHDGRTTIEATLAPGQNNTAWWASRLGAPSAPVVTPPKEVRFLTDVKTLISVTDSEISTATLAEVTVVQGEPDQFTIVAPDGFEMTGSTGQTLVASDVEGKSIRLRVLNGAARSHQFLISMVKANTGAKADVPLISFLGTQRETGEVLIEGEGAIDLRATERGGLRRMDSKEASPYLRSLGRAPVHAAFRYQKKAAEMPALELEWTRFPDSPVLSAVAQQAVVTTLVTSEGRSLTEVKLTLKNQSQPFLKVGLPPGASILSADVGGDKVKPVQGADGSRVPLLRPGFRPKDSYVVSFVFQHAGAPFEKKGGAELSLPKMDIPIGLVAWEVFLPKQFKVADFGGDAIPAIGVPIEGEDDSATPTAPVPMTSLDDDPRSLVPGQIRGVIMDAAGGAVSNALVELVNVASDETFNAASDRNGRWAIGVPQSGRILIKVQAPGFQRMTRPLDYHANRGLSVNMTLQVGSASESVQLSADATKAESRQNERNLRQNAAAPPEMPASSNVAEFQRRVIGVLPIAVSVPRTGNSYRFIRPLAVDEETRLTFTYRTGK
jgi:hypothetical protein